MFGLVELANRDALSAQPRDNRATDQSGRTRNQDQNCIPLSILSAVLFAFATAVAQFSTLSRMVSRFRLVIDRRWRVFEPCLDADQLAVFARDIVRKARLGLHADR